MTALSEIAKYTSSIQELPKKDQSQLIHRKKRARRISQVSGGLSLAALASRSPQLTRATAGRIPKLARTGAVKRIVAAEPRATNASNTLGIMSLGTGAIGSFNYAGIQRAETKADEKAIKKRDDRFLRNYRNRISTDAEAGYQYLRHGRNVARADSAANAAISAGSTAAGVMAARVFRGPMRALTVGSDAVVAVHTGRNSAKSYQKQKRWNEHMNKIKARAYQRAADGEYGRDRVIGKALIPTGALKPKVLNGTRAGGVVRRGMTTYTRRGSIVGTGRSL